MIFFPKRCIELWIGLMLMMAATTAHSQSRIDADQVVGPNRCAECHSQEAQVWRATHHSLTFEHLKTDKKAKEIAAKMGVKKIRQDKTCAGCHFTQQKFFDVDIVVSGVSCESCHGAGAKWIDIHSKFSGKKRGQESLEEITDRWQASEEAGMVRPYQLYQLAANCVACHSVPNQDLIDIASHPGPSSFDLVAWTQGEIRHNFWSTNRERNRAADADSKRLMFVVGIIADLEASLRALAVATRKGPFAIAQASRIAKLRAQLRILSVTLTEVDELRDAFMIVETIAIELNSKEVLISLADGIRDIGISIVEDYNGSEFELIDALIPKPNEFKGRPAAVKKSER